MATRIKSGFIQTAATGAWVGIPSLLTLANSSGNAKAVAAIEISNADGELLVRNKNETSKTYTYEQDELYILPLAEGNFYNVSDLEFFAANGNAISGEYFF